MGWKSERLWLRAGVLAAVVTNLGSVGCGDDETPSVPEPDLPQLQVSMPLRRDRRRSAPATVTPA